MSHNSPTLYPSGTWGIDCSPVPVGEMCMYKSVNDHTDMDNVCDHLPNSGDYLCVRWYYTSTGTTSPYLPQWESTANTAIWITAFLAIEVFLIVVFRALRKKLVGR